MSHSVDMKLSCMKGSTYKKTDVAVIGMACRFPKADDIYEFWELLDARKSGISEIPKDRWDWNKYYGNPWKEKNKTNVKYGGFIRDLDKFDGPFFGISETEATYMDPQQRLVLELVWSCIEDSGYNREDLSGTNTGLFIGVCTSDYQTLMREYLPPVESYTTSGLSRCILANRVSFLLGTHGPSEPIDTACSSSLIAIHRAYEAVYKGECDMVIAGGVNALLCPFPFISFTKAGMLSPDGKCLTFDARANGYVRGEGCGIILLKRLDKAITDNDHIYGIIKGSSINHGGKAYSLTAPNVYSQAQVIINSNIMANTPPDTIGYIEAHGTGTILGDPMEIHGLKRAFRRLFTEYNIKAEKKSYCGIGSVKTNIGHCEGAAGVAGVIKVLLSLKKKRIAGLHGFQKINPKIKIKNSPFYIASESREWKQMTDKQGNLIPRRAGVSSFGFGGANAHIIFEEYIPRGDRINKTTNISTKEKNAFVFSAKKEQNLVEYVHKFINYLENNKDTVSCDDIAYTLFTGRKEMEERLAIIAENNSDLLKKLNGFLQKGPDDIDVFRGKVITSKNEPELTSNGNIRELLQAWVFGAKIPWKMLSGKMNLKRVSLPTYPFSRIRYYLSDHEGSSPDSLINKNPVSNNKQTIRKNKVDEEDFKKLWEKEVGGVEFDPNRNLLEFDSITLITLANKLQSEYGVNFNMSLIFNGYDTARKIVTYLKENAKSDNATDSLNNTQNPETEEAVNIQTLDLTQDLEQITSLFSFCNPHKWFYPREKKKQPIVFIITSMRHGSSLTSFILNAHPHIYAPQGLYLLPFTNLEERAEVLRKQVLFLDEGFLHTIQDLWKINTKEAEELVNEWTIKRIPIDDIYEMIQEKCAPRILVDRGTMYALHPEILKRSNRIFLSAKYIHLIRHPYSVLRSGISLLKKTALFKQIITKEQYDNEVLDEKLCVLIDKMWQVTHINSNDFFKKIDKQKQYRIRFEDLVTNPEKMLKELCVFLEIPFDPFMLTPYEVPENVALHNKKGKAGISSIDPNVMKKNQINPKTADNWKLYSPKRFLSAATRHFTKKYKYQIPEEKKKSSDILYPLNDISKGVPLYVIPGSGGNLIPFKKLLSDLSRPVLALKMVEYAPYNSFQNLALFFSDRLPENEETCSLLGYSSGAFIAWEMGACLIRKGITVKDIILIDRNPFAPDSKISINGLQVLEEKYKDVFHNGKANAEILFALILFAKISYGIQNDSLPELIEKLVSSIPEKKNLYNIFTAFVADKDLTHQGIEKFVFPFLNTRNLIQHYSPSRISDSQINKKLIRTENKNEKSILQDGIIEEIIKGYDHFSLLSAPKIKQLLFSELS